MDDDSKKIGNYITYLRKKKGYSQKELGDKLFVSNNTISKWERGSLLPDIDNIKKLADILDTNVESIIYGEDKNIRKSKKIKFISIFLIIISLIIFCLVAIKIIKNHYKWTIKTFDNTKIVGSVKVRGQIATNMERTIIYIQFLSVDEMYYGTDQDKIIDNYRLQLLYNDKLLTEEVGIEDHPRSIYKVFEYYTKNFEIKKIEEKDYDKIELRIIVEKDGNDYMYSFKPAGFIKEEH